MKMYIAKFWCVCFLSVLAGTWIVRLALYFFYKLFERSVRVNTLSFRFIWHAIGILKRFKIDKDLNTFSIRLFITSCGTLIKPIKWSFRLHFELKMNWPRPQLAQQTQSTKSHLPPKLRQSDSQAWISPLL